MTEPNVPNTDHDELIKLVTSVDILCSKLDRIDKKIDRQQVTCAGRVEKCNDVFVRHKTFWSVVTLFAIVIGALYGWTYDNSKAINKHLSDAPRLHDRLHDAPYYGFDEDTEL